MNIRTATKGTKVKGIPTEPLEEKTVEEIQGTAGVEAPEKTSPVTPDDFEGNGLIQEYMTFIEDHGVTKDDVFHLLESIMTTGYLEWETSINKGRTPVIFRMRPVWAEDVIAKNIDKLSSDKNLSMARFSNVLRMLNLAASMVQFGERKFDVDNEEAFDASVEFIKSLPYPVFAAVTTQLAVFDRAIAVATSEWAMKNFTEPRKENS